MVLPWVKWDQIERPKSLGGWGLKNTNLFAKAFAAKASWRIITTKILWSKVVYHKYIIPVPLRDWIINSITIPSGSGSIIWKEICNAFPLVHSGLSWKIGNGMRVRTGANPWLGSQLNHLLPQQLVQLL